MLTVAEFVWAVKPGSPIQSIKDFKGRKIGYTNPRSTSQALAILLLQAAGLKADDAELIKTGGFGEGVAALDLGLIDVAPLAEPIWSKYKSKYRAVAVASDILPPLDNVVGVSTAAAMASKGDFIRAVIRARRKAVEFMHANPDEAGDIVAKHYNLDKEVARSAVRSLIASRHPGHSLLGFRPVHLDGMKRMVEVQRMVGALSGEVDLAKMIDTRFLPDDIKTPKSGAAAGVSVSPAHVPEKWKPVFRKDMRKIKEAGAHHDAAQSGCAPAHVSLRGVAKTSRPPKPARSSMRSARSISTSPGVNSSPWSDPPAAGNRRCSS